MIKNIKITLIIKRIFLAYGLVKNYKTEIKNLDIFTITYVFVFSI